MDVVDAWSWLPKLPLCETGFSGVSWQDTSKLRTHEVVV